MDLDQVQFIFMQTSAAVISEGSCVKGKAKYRDQYSSISPLENPRSALR